MSNWNLEIEGSELVKIVKSIKASCCGIIDKYKIRKEDWQKVIDKVSSVYKKTNQTITITNIEEEFIKYSQTLNNLSNKYEDYKDRITTVKIFCGCIDWLFKVNEITSKMFGYAMSTKANQMNKFLGINAYNVHSSLNELGTKEVGSKTVLITIENIINSYKQSLNSIKYKY